MDNIILNADESDSNLNNGLNNISNLLESYGKSINEQKEIVNQHLLLFDAVLESLERDRKKIKQLEEDVFYLDLYFNIALYLGSFIFLLFLLYGIFHK
jgi:hypothetical protein